MLDEDVIEINALLGVVLRGRWEAGLDRLVDQKHYDGASGVYEVRG
jgi:hypothetical protein